MHHANPTFCSAVLWSREQRNTASIVAPPLSDLVTLTPSVASILAHFHFWLASSLHHANPTSRSAVLWLLEQWNTASIVAPPLSDLVTFIPSVAFLARFFWLAVRLSCAFRLFVSMRAHCSSVSGTADCRGTTGG